MPVIGEVAHRFAGERPFEGTTIGMSLHLEPKTAVLVRTLVAGGARVVATGNLGTTQDDVVAALRTDGVETFGSRSDSPEDHARNLAAVLDAGPDLLLDNGADLAAGAVDLPVRGGTEETTSGALRLRGELSGRVGFPVIVINDSPLKAIVENEHAVGQSIVESFQRITNLMLQGRRFVVVGYGWCGRGIARYARALGALVTVVEPDEIKALEAAMEGLRVAPIDVAVVDADVVITATGAEGVVSADHAETMSEGAILANAGHFDREIDVEAIRERSVDAVPAGDALVRYTMPSGRRVVVVAEGRMMNLAGPGPKGNSIESMDLGFTLQALSLERIATAPDTLVAGPQPVPDDIDRHAAAAMVRSIMR